MTSVAVEFRGISKRFTLRHHRARSFQDYVINAFRPSEPTEDFWALRDVTFQVPRGCAFGIVGENGSGKSTALKLIAGILRPTAGDLRVHGKLAALLELGAGFHPDLTGRENIFLNASILGIPSREVNNQLDAIVAFAELERFVDTPLKHYSSGMIVRLGFAIAIHADPEILITDEVLSVGDESFQRKCITWIDGYLRSGRTVILVSHSLDLVRAVCERAVWLDRGVARAIGTSLEITDAYLAHAEEMDRGRHADGAAISFGADGRGRRWGTREIEITRVELLDATGIATPFFQTGGPLTVRTHYRAPARVPKPLFGVAVHYGDHVHLNGPNTGTGRLPIESVEGSGFVDYVVPSLPLLSGLYHLSAAVYDERGVHAFDHHDRAYSFHVQSSRVGEHTGLVWFNGEWRHSPEVMR
ncbi:MAG: ABC transporter ATP-binding protein [Chloroflexota bacterium]|nr:MAG: ABC transporter ATP-binding protein [Chloroflexota bacterium]